MRNIFVKIFAILSVLSLLACAGCGKPDKTEMTEPATQTTAATETATETATEAVAPSEAATEPEQTEVAEETTEAAQGPQTKAEAIACVNDAVNAVKSGKAGFKKVYKRDAAGDINGLPSWLKDIIHQDETSTQAKGKDSTDVFPAAGYSWSSHLRESDVQSYSVDEQGDCYVIRLNLGKEKNPAPGESSSYGRCMSVVTVDSAESIPGISNVSMDYHDGFVSAKINKETGKVVECTFSAAADVSADVVLLGSISVQSIVSSETFSDFVW